MLQWLWNGIKRLTGRSGRLLVVEPREDAMKLLRAHLRPLGFSIQVVSSPREAIRAVRAQEKPPHALIVNIRKDSSMTKVLESTFELTSERAVARSPILVFHDPLSAEALAQCKHFLPRVEFLQRPYIGSHMRRRVRHAVRRGQRRPLAKSSIRNSSKLIPPPPRLRTKS